MLRILFSLALTAVVLLINIYYYGIKSQINLHLLIPNVIALIASLIGYFLTYKLKNLKKIYYNISTGFIFLIVSQSFLVAYFLTNQPLLTLSISEIFIKLPGIILILAGFVEWLKVKELREQTLKEQEEKWKSIVEGVSDIIIIIQDGIIRYINSKVKDVLGFEADEIKGKPVTQFITEEEVKNIKEKKQNRLKIKSKSGKTVYFEVSSSFIPFDGKPAFLGILRDITEKLKKELELIEIKEKLHEAQKLAKVGYWEVQLPEKQFRLSEEAMDIFCSPASRCSYTFDEFLEIVRPEFREELRIKRKKAVEELLPYEAEYRVNTPAGEKIIKEKVKIILDRSRNKTILGIVQDVTEIHIVYQQVLENEERYRNLFEYSNDAIIIADMEGNIQDTNQKAVYKLGYSKVDLQVLNIRNIFGRQFSRVFPEWLKKLYINGHMRFETEVITSDERVFPAEVSASVFEIKDRKYIQLIVRDITERKLAEKELKLASIVFDNALEGIIITDKEGSILRVNQALTELTGYTKKEVLGWNIRAVPLFAHRDGVFTDIWKRAVKAGKWQGEFSALRKNGSLFPVWMSVIQVKNKNEISNYIIILSDITQRKQREEKLKSLAYYDNLTGLPNRVHFFSKLKQAVEKTYTDGKKVSLFFVDLDGFKQVNDSYGHEVGDKLLKEVAKRLRASIRKDDFVARLAGDEFVILIEGVEEKEVLKKISQKIIQNISKPYVIDGFSIKIGASIGISILPDDAHDLETFLKHADFAMYHSKLTGKNRFTFYSDIIQDSQ
ncbi:PAS domain S-box protein [Persephonella sp.]